MPGPVPKRSNQRRRRDSSAVSLRTVQVDGVVEVPAADESWHPIAGAWYTSLAESAQSQFYEPSDWAYAFVWAEVLSRQLASGRPSARMLASWQSAASDLLTTEASRRRVRVEVDRRQLQSVPEPSQIDDYRNL